MDEDNKTEEPTHHKLVEARKKGQVLKSTDAASAFLGLAIFLALMIMGQKIFYTFCDVVKGQIQMMESLSSGGSLNPQAILTQFLTAIGLILLPIFAVVLVGGIGGNLLQTGWLTSLESIRPEMDKINPISGFKRVFSSKGLMEFAKTAFRTALIYWILKVYLEKNLPVILKGSLLGISDAIILFGTTLQGFFYKVTMLLVILGGLDYVLQRYYFLKKMRMTKQEVKEEYKSLEGDPFLKQRMKSRQRELVKQRMLDGVKTSRVVITNPTHLAVALKYDEDQDEAPIVVAKGRDHLAEQIKTLARKHGVKIHENKPLARSIFDQVKVGQQIPPELYLAVAEVIAFVERLDAQMQGGN